MSAPGSASSTTSSTVSLSSKILERVPMDRWNWLLHTHYTRRDSESCRALITRLENETNGLCEYAHYVRGLLLREEGRVQESVDAFQQCILLNPNSVDNLKQVARSLFLLGRHKAALDLFLEASKLAPSDANILYNIGVCYFHMQDGSHAKEAFNSAIRAHPTEAAFQLLARCFIAENDLNAAIETYRKALETTPESADLLTNLGLVYLQKGDFPKSFECLGSALSIDPKNSRAILAAGSLIQSYQDFDVALNKYRVVAQREPENAAVWNNMGMCFYGKGKLLAAIACLKRASYLSPLDWKALYNLGLVHIAAEQPASAFHFLSAAVNHKPRFAPLYHLLAVALTHLGDQESAEQAYEEAIKADERDPLISLNLAVFHYKLANLAVAARHLSEYERKLAALKATSSKLDVDPEMLEVANALGGAIQVGDSSLWRLPAAQQQPPTSVSPAAASQKQQPPPPQKMRGAEYHTYEEIGRVVTPAAAGEPSSARATAGEAERALGTDTGAERESVRAKPRKSRQKEAADT